MSSSATGMQYDILWELLNVREDQVHIFIRNYGTIAPYPILHYESLVGVVRQILDQRQAFQIRSNCLRVRCKQCGFYSRTRVLRG